MLESQRPLNEDDEAAWDLAQRRDWEVVRTHASIAADVLSLGRPHTRYGSCRSSTTDAPRMRNFPVPRMPQHNDPAAPPAYITHEPTRRESHVHGGHCSTSSGAISDDMRSVNSISSLFMVAPSSSSQSEYSSELKDPPHSPQLDNRGVSTGNRYPQGNAHRTDEGRSRQHPIRRGTHDGSTSNTGHVSVKEGHYVNPPSPLFRPKTAPPSRLQRPLNSNSSLRSPQLDPRQVSPSTNNSQGNTDKYNERPAGFQVTRKNTDDSMASYTIMEEHGSINKSGPVFMIPAEIPPLSQSSSNSSNSSDSSRLNQKESPIAASLSDSITRRGGGSSYS